MAMNSFLATMLAGNPTESIVLVDDNAPAHRESLKTTAPHLLQEVNLDDSSRWESSPEPKRGSITSSPRIPSRRLSLESCESTPPQAPQRRPSVTAHYCSSTHRAFCVKMPKLQVDFDVDSKRIQNQP